MLQITRVHGYGVPQIMSGWQAGQERRERKAAREEEKERWGKQFDLREKEYGLSERRVGLAEEQFQAQQESAEAEVEEKKRIRKLEIGKRGDKFWEQSVKFGDDPALTHVKNKFKELALRNWEMAYDMKFDRELLDRSANIKDQEEAAMKQLFNNIQTKINTATSESLDSAALALSNIATNKKYKDLVDGMYEQIKEVRKNIGKMTDIEEDEAKVIAAEKLATAKVEAEEKKETVRKEEFEQKEYRDWFGKATKEAIKRVFANKPEKQQEFNIFLDTLEQGNLEEAGKIEDRLTEEMTKEQYNLYQQAIEDFFLKTKGVPKNIKEQFLATLNGSNSNIPEEQKDESIPQAFLEFYRKKYPGRSDEEIEREWKKATQTLKIKY